jgi:hypothetical protein
MRLINFGKNKAARPKFTDTCKFYLVGLEEGEGLVLKAQRFLRCRLHVNTAIISFAVNRPVI